jgi:hypothetical protein
MAGCGGGPISGPNDDVGDSGSGSSGPFVVDPHLGGTTTELRLVETFWGLLVDVYDLDGNGEVGSQPVYRDFVIRENLFPDGTNFRLVTNPVTQKTRLVIMRSRESDRAGFDALVTEASEPLSPIAPRNDNGSSSPPFSFVARNATLVLRFNDLLQDDAEAESNLASNVIVKTGYPPETPFMGRVFFDRGHGGVVGDRFHSTRVLVDLTVSEAEAASAQVSLALNSIGLPASVENEVQPNVSVRIPVRVDFGSGQFTVLESLSGFSLGAEVGEPTDPFSVTGDVVRAMRSGNVSDLNGGFVLDLNEPQVLGAWPMQILNAEEDPAGLPGFDFLIAMRFATICQSAVRIGDVIQVGERIFLEVREDTSSPNGAGELVSVSVRSILEDRIASPFELLAPGLFLSTLSLSAPVPLGCWLNFLPQPLSFPAAGVSTEARVQVRFSEPMQPKSLTPFQSFMLVRGNSSLPAGSGNIVVGRVNASEDLRVFTLSPQLPLQHQEGSGDAYTVRLEGVTDLAGNSLETALPFVDFNLDSDEPSVNNAGVVMRFQSTDEVAPFGHDDLRGQLFFNFERGVITPRPVTFTAVPADRSHPVPSIMVPFPPGVQTPLSPLGSKLQAVWRYVEFGWQVQDETHYNVDVLGLSWAPIGGQVISDFFEEFEIALAHSRRLPDEDVDGNLLPKHENSGLRGRNNLFTDNILIDPLSPQKVVHPRVLGYRVDSTDLFLSSSGVVMMPYPLNRDPQLEPVTYTWRDTAVLSKAGPGGVGIPLDREVGQPLALEDPDPGRIASANQVPSFGLPLLVEYRMFPSDQGFGLNALDISLAINSSALPAFRAYSTGGFNTSSEAVRVDPDTELTPKGGFNPNSNPPGKRTRRADDNSVYIGQLDIVSRISRVHTAWINTELPAADFFTPVVLPGGSDRPPGTDVILEYRGAANISLSDGDDDNAPFDARQLNPYGEMFSTAVDGEISLIGEISFVGTDGTWTDDINVIDQSRFFQVRISFVNNIETGRNPELSALGFAFMPSL